ncbi:MAG: hypothetical protein IPK87_01495 [Planctomycetes bacterium]|nr:hypothetical protein [Planctomycetota bacterium]
MSDLSAEKWQELQSKLEVELGVASAALQSSSRRFHRAVLICGVVLAAGIGVVVAGLFAFPDQRYYVASPLGILIAVLVFALLQVRRGMTVSGDEKQRIERDIRAWKKRKPGSIFDKQAKA